MAKFIISGKRKGNDYMSINRSADRETLDLSGGYCEVLKEALFFNDSFHENDDRIFFRNEEIRRDLKYVHEDGTLSSFKSMLPKYIYMLIENFDIMAQHIKKTSEMLEKGEIENNDTGNYE